MKKILSMLLVFSMLLGCTAAVAEGMGVQVIGGLAMNSEPVSLDDVQLGREVTIDGYATILPTDFSFQDRIGFYAQGKTKPVPASFYDNSWWINSGDDADYAILKMDILNLAMTEKEYLNNVEVKVVFDDVYEYGGWTGQYNYSNATDDHSKYFGEATNKQNTEFIIDKADHFSIGPMYEGHYCFGCTLPNAVVSSKKPLRMIITIDGNEITYNIRK